MDAGWRQDNQSRCRAICLSFFDLIYERLSGCIATWYVVELQLCQHQHFNRSILLPSSLKHTHTLWHNLPLSFFLSYTHTRFALNFVSSFVLPVSKKSLLWHLKLLLKLELSWLIDFSSVKKFYFYRFSIETFLKCCLGGVDKMLLSNNK